MPGRLCQCGESGEGGGRGGRELFQPGGEREQPGPGGPRQTAGSGPGTGIGRLRQTDSQTERQRGLTLKVLILKLAECD